MGKRKKNWEHLGKNLYCDLKKKTSGRIIRADYRIPEVKLSKLSLGKWNTFKSNVYGVSKVNNDFWIEYKFS